MKRNLIFLLLISLLLAAGIAAWWMTPRIEEISPAPGSEPLLGEQPLQIAFSRPMNPESVEAHLSAQPPQAGAISWNQAQDSLAFIPRQAWPSGETLTLRLDAGAKAQRGLPLLQSHTWDFEISPNHLVYLWPADGNSNLYALNLETGDSQALTAYPTGVLDFDVSADGLRLYYSVWHSSEESALYAFDRLTGETLPLLECSQALCRSPRISPTSRYLAYKRIPQAADESPSLRLYDLENQYTIQVGEPGHFTANARWSSRGWLAYYDHTLQAFIFVDPAGEEIAAFPNETGASGDWSPGGDVFLTSEILYLEDGLAPRHLLAFSPETGLTRDFTLKDYLEDANPVYSPGDHIAFERKCLVASCWSPGRQLWIMSSDGERAHPLTDAPDYNHTAFAWHPDGQRLAYVRYNNAQISEPPEIWVINRSGTGKTRLVINGYAPRWLP